jgi:hypothetical protein
MNSAITNIEIYHKLNTIKPKHLIKKNNTLQDKLKLIKTLEKQDDNRIKSPIYKASNNLKQNRGGQQIIIYH